MMQCMQCGTQFPDGSPVCPNCGTPTGNQPYGGQSYGGQNLSKTEFLKHPNLKKVSSNIRGSAIVLYICAGISLVAALLTSNFFSLIDVAIILGLALGIHLAQSRVCAILICVYSAFNTIVMFLSSGTFGGWLIVLAAIYAIISTFKFQKAWAEYQRTGILPAP